MGVKRIVEPIVTRAEEGGQILRRLLLHPRQIRIKLAEEMAAELRLRISRAKPADPGLLEYVVACEDLVGAFSGQNDLHLVVADEL